MLPTPTIKVRDIDAQREKSALDAGLDPLVARIIASRPGIENCSPESFIRPKLSSLDHPCQLADIETAAARLIIAIENNEVIGLETDHDCDGQTSHAVLYHSLVTLFNYPKNKIRTYIGHRLVEGYGLSLPLCKRILDDKIKPQLIITADNGSSDEAQIELLKKENIDVIVTDHHEIPKSGIPKSAVAVLNPTRSNCGYPDASIAGCMVAWLFMAEVRRKLIAAGKLSPNTPSMACLLDFVAVGTIADCVSMSRSHNNRAVVQYGLKLIQSNKRPCWRALKKWIGHEIEYEDIGFKVGPLLNADGRLDDALSSVSLLLTQDEDEASQWVNFLSEQNQTRKTIQERMIEESIPLAISQINLGKKSICIFLDEGHSGIHGISASRIKDLTGRPTIIFSPKQGDHTLITGSARGIDGDFHLRDALEWINENSPSTIVKFGGHKGAAGLTIYREQFKVFSQYFERAVDLQLGELEIGPIIWTDGELTSDYISIDVMSKISMLEPFGREFEPPIFSLIGEVMNIQWMGKAQNHARVRMRCHYKLIEMVWFKARLKEDDPEPIKIGDTLKVALQPKINKFRGIEKFNPQILAVEAYHGNV